MAIRISTAVQWFDFTDEPGVRFQLAPLTRTRLMALHKEANGDEEALQKLVWGEMLQDWEGILDDAGNKLQVTDENKNLIRENLAFSMWIDKHTKGYVKAVEEETKN